ncbi:MAG: adenylate/guanylate cyclase domain-containing protein [Stappiaceae bacterium]
MQSPQFRLSGKLLGILLLLACAISFWYPGSRGGQLSGIEGQLLNLRYELRGPRIPPEEIVIIAIDDAALANQSGAILPRQDIARLVNTASQAGARTIGLDLLLIGSGGDASSVGGQALVNALSEQESTVIAVAASPTTALPGSTASDPSRTTELRDLIAPSLFKVVIRSDDDEVLLRSMSAPDTMLVPAPEFIQVSRLGHVNVNRESDGSVRHAALALPVGDNRFLPSLPLITLLQYFRFSNSDLQLAIGQSVRIGPMSIPTRNDGAVALNYYGGRQTFTTISASDILANKISPDTLSGKIVLIGSDASGLGDKYSSPYALDLAGVEVLATITGNLIQQKSLKRNETTWALTALLAFLSVAMIFVAANNRNSLVSLMLIVLTWITILTFAQWAFASADIWLDGMTLVATLAVATLVAMIGRIRTLKGRTDQLATERGNLARYLPPLLSDVLARSARPSFDARSQEAVVLFVDVTGFTARSEKLGPEGTVSFLRNIHAIFEESAYANQGVLEQFMGDGAMIIFGLPETTEKDTVHALNCAASLLRQVGDLNERYEETNETPVTIRISINRGPVIAAVLGSDRQATATVAGDTVNVSSRLQDTAKQANVELVVSQSVSEDAGLILGEAFQNLLSPLGELPVRGRGHGIKVWQLQPKKRDAFLQFLENHDTTD